MNFFSPNGRGTKGLSELNPLQSGPSISEPAEDFIAGLPSRAFAFAESSGGKGTVSYGCKLRWCMAYKVLIFLLHKDHISPSFC